MEHNLEVIPVINRSTYPAPKPERVLDEIESVLGIRMRKSS
jgi:translation elongation factor EF-4